MHVTTSDHTVEARGLRFHVRRWTPERRARERIVYLLHGFADAITTWDEVARRIAARGLVVAGHDQRGFGETSRVSSDGYYHFFDYVADLDELLDAAGSDVFLVGHSMGGTVACLYAGSRPDRVSGLALLEGLGPPDTDPRAAPDRAARWLEGLRADPRHAEAPTKRHVEALDRLARLHPMVPREALEAHVPALFAGAPDALSWRMDPLHRTTSPVPFYAAAFCAFASRVTCPTWLVHGGPSGFHPEDEAERRAAFRDVREHEIANAGHMMHWTRPEAVAELLTAAALGVSST